MAFRSSSAAKSISINRPSLEAENVAVEDAKADCNYIGALPSSWSIDVALGMTERTVSVGLEISTLRRRYLFRESSLIQQ